MPPAGSESRRKRPPGPPLLAAWAVGFLCGLPAGSIPAAALGAAACVAVAALHTLLRRCAARVDVERFAPAVATEGDRVRVRVRIVNRSRIPLFQPKVLDVFGPETGAVREIVFARRIDPGRSAEEEYEAVCLKHRGVYPHGPAVLVVADPFGWCEVRRPAGTTVECKVYPRLRHSRLPELVLRSLTDPEAIRRSAVAGGAEEFHSVRDYVPGDSPKCVHWALTARRSWPVVREFLPSVHGELAIFLDVSRQLRFSGARLANFEASVRLVASLASRAAGAGFRVRLVGGGRGLFDVPSGAGSGHLVRILDTLVRVRTREEDDFAHALARGAAGPPGGGAAVIVLHPYLQGDARIAAAIARLQRRGHRVVIVAYGVREAARSEGRARKHAAWLAHLAERGAEIWDETGARAGLRPAAEARR